MKTLSVRLRTGERAPVKCVCGRVVERQTQLAQTQPFMGSNPILTTKEVIGRKRAKSPRRPERKNNREFVDCDY